MSPPRRRSTPKEPKGRKGKPAPGKAVAQRPPLVAHPKANGGKLYQGGVPGNRGGIGRPPSQVRAMAREMFADRLPRLGQIADGEVTVALRETCPECGYEPPKDARGLEDVLRMAPRASDVVSAIDKLGKYGLGEADDSLTREQVADYVKRATEIIGEHFLVPLRSALPGHESLMSSLWEAMSPRIVALYEEIRLGTPPLDPSDT